MKMNSNDLIDAFDYIDSDQAYICGRIYKSGFDTFDYAIQNERVKKMYKKATTYPSYDPQKETYAIVREHIATHFPAIPDNFDMMFFYGSPCWCYIVEIFY